MHLFNNLKQVAKGLGIKKHLWFAARATTDFYYKRHMEVIRQVLHWFSVHNDYAPTYVGFLKFLCWISHQISNKAHVWLAAKPKSQWSRSGFRTTCKSDMFVNNHCEVFNKAITNFRDMGIVAMFKAIQLSCMDRIQRRKTKVENSIALYCKKPLKKIHE